MQRVRGEEHLASSRQLHPESSILYFSWEPKMYITRGQSSKVIFQLFLSGACSPKILWRCRLDMQGNTKIENLKSPSALLKAIYSQSLRARCCLYKQKCTQSESVQLIVGRGLAQKVGFLFGYVIVVRQWMLFSLYILLLPLNILQLKMGACNPDANSEKITTSDFSFQANLHQRKEDLLYYLQQLDYTPPVAKCSSSSQDIKYVCISEQCKIKAFHCDNESCGQCSHLHRYCEKVQTNYILQLFRVRAERQKKFILEMERHDKELFDQIQERRNENIKRFVERQKEEYENNLLEAMLLKQPNFQVEGRHVKEMLERMKKLEKETQTLSQTLLKDYRTETLKLSKYYTELQESALNRFANLKLSPFQHPDNPHNDRFVLAPEPRKVKITLKFQDQHWYNFVKNNRIMKNSVASFFVKQVKTKQYSIMTGICTSEMMGKRDAYNSQHVVTYVSGDGYVCENGVEKKCGRAVKDGEVITVGVDTINWKISWAVDLQRLGQATIPEGIRDKDLFLTIMMFNHRDEAEILIK